MLPLAGRHTGCGPVLGCVHCVRLCSLSEVVLCYLWQAITLDVGLCVRMCSLCEVVL